MRVIEYRSIMNEDGIALKECGSYVADNRRSFNNPDALADFFSNAVGIGNCADEFVYVACLDTKNKMLACFQASHGSVNASMFPVREIMQKALLAGAVSIAVSHNHPSGDVTPSAADVQSTENLKNACAVVGVPLIDHVIVSGNKYLSFHEHNWFS